MDPDSACDPERHDIYYFVDQCVCDYRMLDDYYKCLQLSQVSRQFTSELGMCLWQNVTVGFDDPHVIFLVVQTRPAALSHIRGMCSLHIQCHGDAFETPSSLLREICKFTSSNLKVRFFTVVLSTILTVSRDSFFGHDAAEARLDDAAEIFRELEIDGAFDVSFVPGYPWGRGSSSYKEDPLFRRVRESWLPACVGERELEKEKSRREHYIHQ
jgi:hypothetical protein